MTRAEYQNGPVSSGARYKRVLYKHWTFPFVCLFHHRYFVLILVFPSESILALSGTPGALAFSLVFIPCNNQIPSLRVTLFLTENPIEHLKRSQKLWRTC